MIDPRVALLVAGCALFAALIVAELATGSGTGDPALTAAAGVPNPRTAPAALVSPVPKPNELVAANLAKPLFSPTRRPPATPTDSSDTTLGDKRLAGIVIEPQRRLVIFEARGAKPLMLSEGDAVSGWLVEKITPRQVLVRGPGGTMTLEPKLEGTSGVAPPVGPHPTAAAPARSFPRPSPPADRPPIPRAPQHRDRE